MTMSTPASLQELSARVVAAVMPFALVEQRCSGLVPPPVQTIIAEWAFPREEDGVRRYSAAGAFDAGQHMLEAGCVADVMQVGFHLSGVVRCPDLPSATPHRVAMSFDRCRVISVDCSCDGEDVFWCAHAVALALARIRGSQHIAVRPPISETLLSLDRWQLQKLLQHVISSHASAVLPTAQRLADAMTTADADRDQEMDTCVMSAPDPTAGADVDDDEPWFLDEDSMRQQVRAACVAHAGSHRAAERMEALFAKIREMMMSGDCNGSRMLCVLTQELLDDHWLATWKAVAEDGTPDTLDNMWRQIGLLWICAALNPSLSSESRFRLRRRLERWSRPPDVDHLGHEVPRGRLRRRRRRASAVLRLAADAARLTWESPQLRLIVECDVPPTDQECAVNDKGQLVWEENVPWSCARVLSLCGHGLRLEATRLAVAVVRTMRRDWAKQSATPAASNNDTPLDKEEDWLMHPVDPVGTLFDTLAKAHQDQVPIRMRSRRESLLSLAVEAALIGLSRRRSEASVGREAAVLDRLRAVGADVAVDAALRSHAKRLVQEHGRQGEHSRRGPQSFPAYALSAFLFSRLLPADPDLAFSVGMRALRTPATTAVNVVNVVEENHPTFASWTAIGHFEGQQAALAAAIITAAQDDVVRLRLAVDCIQQHVRSASHVFRLAQDALAIGQRRRASSAAAAVVNGSDSAASSSCDLMVGAAFTLGVHALRTSVASINWRRREMVAWMVNCAAEVGCDAVVSVLQSWRALLTAAEAMGVATAAASSALADRLGVIEATARHGLAACVRETALQCAQQDPSSCGLSALTLCESDPVSFEAVHETVSAAAAVGAMSPLQAFAVAKYLQQKGLEHRAFRMAISAARTVHVHANQDSHPSLLDLQWCCSLALSLGDAQMAAAADVMASNVASAGVLGQLVRRCAGASPTALRPLAEAAVAAFVHAAHAKLANISPRHYVEFVDFLLVARDTFAVAEDGAAHFHKLILSLKATYRGKKKLIALVTEKFGP